MPSVGSVLQHAWNIFRNARSSTPRSHYGGYMSYNPSHERSIYGRRSDRSIVTSVLNRISMDVASIDFIHAKLDEDGRFSEEVKDSLNTCMRSSANLDQTGRALIQDIAHSLLDDGVVAVVPTDYDEDDLTGERTIEKLRVGFVTEWFPGDVTVRLYNEHTGQREDVTLPKTDVALIENPLFATVNEPNSTMQRMIRKLAILDAVDEESGAGKIDLIVQLPWSLKSEAHRKQAEVRRKDIEMQLTGSKYGIAYIDSTEHITQLNRSLDNHLMDQIKYLQELLYSQLGITVEIMNGTASADAMTNYYSRTVEPLVSAIVDEFRRKFLSDEQREDGETILFFRDPFKLVPISQMADLADKLTRNEIMSPNEIRQKIGLRPSQDSRADELRNRNINAGEEQDFANSSGNEYSNEEEDSK